jgi:ParB family chromosome partitioning protein
MAIAGAFISLDPQGRLQVERGYVRPEDELPVPVPVPTVDAETGAGSDPHDQTVDQTVAAVASGTGTTTPVQARTIAAASQTGPSISAHPADLVEEDEGVRPLSERLVAELTAHRTLGLRNALADDWDAAHLSVLHAFCLPLFYRRAGESCLEITVRSVGFLAQAPGSMQCCGVCSGFGRLSAHGARVS